MERASVRVKGSKRARSNKFSGGDKKKRPASHTKKATWVGGYVKKIGTHVRGYFRSNAGYRNGKFVRKKK